MPDRTAGTCPVADTILHFTIVPGWIVAYSETNVKRTGSFTFLQEKAFEVVSETFDTASPGKFVSY